MGQRMMAELRAVRDRLSEIIAAAACPACGADYCTTNHTTRTGGDDRLDAAYQDGHRAALADAQAFKAILVPWMSARHTPPADEDERAAWMRGYGRQFAHWGGADDSYNVARGVPASVLEAT